MTDDEVSREEIIDLLFRGIPTDPDTLDWKPLLKIFKNILRLRMNITRQNASWPLIDACRFYIYPDEDIPEVKGLMTVLDRACKNANLDYRLIKGPRKLQEGGVSYFEPYKIELPFKKAKLSMTIAPGEFQWIIEKARKEKDLSAKQLEKLKQELLRETKEWLRRGNR